MILSLQVEAVSDLFDEMFNFESQTFGTGIVKFSGRSLDLPPNKTVKTISMYSNAWPGKHCAKVHKYEQGKIGLQFFDIWW